MVLLFALTFLTVVLFASSRLMLDFVELVPFSG